MKIKNSLFDSFVVLFIILVIIVLFFTLIYPERASKIVTGKPVYKMVSVDIILLDEFWWIESQINVGETQKNKSRDVISEVSGKRWIEINDRGKFFSAKLLVRARQEAGDVYTFLGRELKIGESIKFENRRIKFEGHICKIYLDQAD